MMNPTLGIDIAKATFDVALLQEGHYRTATFNNDPTGFAKLRRWLKKGGFSQLVVGMEATSRYGEALALFLHEQGHRVSLINPARIKAYADSQLRRNKTDKEDAKTIADFCRSQPLEWWTPPSAAQRELQAMVRHLEALQAARTQERNRLEAGVPSAVVVQTIQAHIAFLESQIAELEACISEHIDRHPDLKEKRELLTSIPGLGKLSAAKFLAEVPDVSRFDSAAQLAAFAGLTPRQRQSGSSVRGAAHLSKTGNKRLRTLFYMPALCALRFNPLIQPLAQRLRERGKGRMTIVGAAMRKLLHLAYGVLKHKRPFDPHYLVNVQCTA